MVLAECRLLSSMGPLPDHTTSSCVIRAVCTYCSANESFGYLSFKHRQVSCLMRKRQESPHQVGVCKAFGHLPHEKTGIENWPYLICNRPSLLPLAGTAPPQKADLRSERALLGHTCMEAQYNCNNLHLSLSCSSVIPPHHLPPVDFL